MYRRVLAQIAPRQSRRNIPEYGRMRSSRKVRRLLPLVPLVFVLGYSLVYALAWVQLYFQEHPYHQASRWMFDNLPQGSILAEPHWDDKLPLSIPGKNAPSFFVLEGRDNELPVYERDTVDKLNLVLKRVARADYIVFPTPRTPDSIPRVPEEFVYTSPFLQLLFAERLGYTLVKTVKTRPSFLGITFNDDLADESFSVYDHPKAVIFKNTEKLPLEELRERVLNYKRYEPLPTLDDILLMDQGGWNKVAHKLDPLPGQVAKAFVALFAMAVCFWVLVGSRLKGLPDNGFGLSFLGGLGLCAGLTWMLAALNIFPFTRTACVAAFLVLLLAAIVRLTTRAAVRHQLYQILPSQGCFALGAVLMGFVVVFATRNLFPDYFWGGGELERFYLSFFARNEELPSGVGWGPETAAGGVYVGHFVSGWLIKFFGVSGPIAYELSFVLLGGALGGVLYSLLVAVVRKPIFALFFTLVALVPSIRGFHNLVHGYDGVASARAELNMGAGQDPLVSWLTSSIKGAPTVIEACDGDSRSQAAKLAGLPTMRLIVGAAAGSADERLNESLRAACSLQDPQAVFDAMMRLGVELLIIGGEGAGPPTRQASIDALSSRPELFAKLYDQSGSVVFAPVFSPYFPRAYHPKAPKER